MTIRHHPSDATLAQFAAGTLDEGSALVVATHVGLCAACRQTVGRFEAVGGALLDRLEPAPLSTGAREAAMTRLDGEGARAIDLGGADVVAEGLPQTLAGHRLGRWRGIGGRVALCSVELRSPSDVRVFLLKAKPGTQLPRHRHQGREWTCVLQGAFTHAGGTYGAGDFDEADETDEHHPSVDPGETCICLVAMQGQIELQSFLGRLIQPLIRL